MKKLSWRLSKLPTPSELTELVQNKIITQEEAREILMQDVEERDTDSLKAEIEFLRKLVERMANGKPQVVVESIQSIPRIVYVERPWYQPYQIWCSSNSNLTGSTGGSFATNTSASIVPGSTTTGTGAYAQSSFSSIKTF